MSWTSFALLALAVATSLTLAEEAERHVYFPEEGVHCELPDGASGTQQEVDGEIVCTLPKGYFGGRSGRGSRLRGSGNGPARGGPAPSSHTADLNRGPNHGINEGKNRDLVRGENALVENWMSHTLGPAAVKGLKGTVRTARRVGIVGRKLARRAARRLRKKQTRDATASKGLVHRTDVRTTRALRKDRKQTRRGLDRVAKEMESLEKLRVAGRVKRATRRSKKNALAKKKKASKTLEHHADRQMFRRLMNKENSERRSIDGLLERDDSKDAQRRQVKRVKREERIKTKSERRSERRAATRHLIKRRFGAKKMERRNMKKIGKQVKRGIRGARERRRIKRVDKDIKKGKNKGDARKFRAMDDAIERLDARSAKQVSRERKSARRRMRDGEERRRERRQTRAIDGTIRSSAKRNAASSRNAEMQRRIARDSRNARKTARRDASKVNRRMGKQYRNSRLRAGMRRLTKAQRRAAAKARRSARRNKVTKGMGKAARREKLRRRMSDVDEDEESAASSAARYERREKRKIRNSSRDARRADRRVTDSMRRSSRRAAARQRRRDRMSTHNLDNRIRNNMPPKTKRSKRGRRMSGYQRRFHRARRAYAERSFGRTEDGYYTLNGKKMYAPFPGRP